MGGSFVSGWVGWPINAMVAAQRSAGLTTLR
jgi:hypothetical protein